MYVEVLKEQHRLKQGKNEKLLFRHIITISCPVKMVLLMPLRNLFTIKCVCVWGGGGLW